MAIWLLKTEPNDYSFKDLVTAGDAVWDGVANPVALKNLRAMKVGDRLFVYHTGDEKAVVGEAVVTCEATSDPKDKTGRLVVIGLRATRALASPVSLATLKAQATFAESPLVKQGRLSVVPITDAQAKTIGDLTKP